MKSALALAREALDLAERSQGDTERAYVGYYEFTTHSIAHYATVARAAIEMAAIVEQLRPRGHDLLCAYARLGPGRGPCDCGYVALCARIDALTKEGEHDADQ